MAVVEETREALAQQLYDTCMEIGVLSPAVCSDMAATIRGEPGTGAYAVRWWMWIIGGYILGKML